MACPESDPLPYCGGWVGVVVGVAVGAAAMLTPVAQAQSGPTGKPASHDVTGVLPGGKIPANAIRFTGRMPVRGAHGAPFSAPTSPTAMPDIVGGTTANSSDFPGVVGVVTLFVANDPSTGQPAVFEAICTGTVLTPTEVLTAAHCDTGFPDATTFVIAGENDIINDTNGFVAGVSSAWTHPQFNLAALNAGTTSVPVDDVEVLTLSNALPSVYTPVTLTQQGDGGPYVAGTSANIVGYGITATGQTDGGVDTCNGDSGGPMFVSGVEAGIIDWGAQPCAAAGTFGVNERLSWYNVNIRAALANPPITEQDWTGDGHSDMLVRFADGSLFDYFGSGLATDGLGGFGGRQQIGTGWNIYSRLLSTGDWNGDGLIDMIAITPGGRMVLYTTNGHGDWQNGGNSTPIGTGWQATTAVF